ncbi:hypothetical protein AAMO2058_001133100 [Amorphochlora amoebiformis]
MSSRTARKAQRQRDLLDAPAPRRQYVRMEEKMVERAFQLAREGYMQKSRGELTHWQEIAKKLKLAFDNQYSGGTKVWNCVVGNHFGSFVSYNTKDMAYFFVAEMGVILWKHG